MVERLRVLARQTFPLVWRATVLLLPWQTRWFAEGPKLAGFPWEEGRISIYASQLAIAGVFVLSSWASTQTWQEQMMAIRSGLHKWGKAWSIALVFIVLSFITTRSLRATLEWWLEVASLALLFWVLRSHIQRDELVFWFVLSLVPEALLAIWQAHVQEVKGVVGLGIASQQPIDLGVAVIERTTHRWLRAYAGFPHPNIFGGWIAFGSLSIIQSLQTNFAKRAKRIFYYIVLCLFSSALIFSYSRSAWMALSLALSFQLFHWLKSDDHVQRKVLRIAFVGMFCAALASIAVRPGLVLSRTQTHTRLEQKSLSERAQGVANGWRVLRASPLTGSGPGTIALAISETDQNTGKAITIPIVPHVVPLLALAEMGIFGLVVACCCVWTLGKAYLTRIRQKDLSLHYALASFLVFLLPLLFLDHYLWSYWSGKALFGLVLLFGAFSVSHAKEE